MDQGSRRHQSSIGVTGWITSFLREQYALLPFLCVLGITISVDDGAMLSKIR